MAKAEEGINKFVYILEIVYAILLSWGFARVAERFVAHHGFYWLCMLISLLVLIRFFFAPSHNVGVIARLTDRSKGAARIVIFFDISVLIAHSFIYFRMCYAMGDMHYDYFYRDLSLLLLLNSIWLITIMLRQRKARVNPHDKHAFWTLNNLICGFLIILLFLFDGPLILMFLVALVNCVLDLWVCAPYYLESV